MSIESIRHQLTSLKLYTAAKELPDVLAAEKRTVALDWLENLLSREVDHRKEKAVMKRIKEAEFPEITTLEQFDWDFNSGIDRPRIMRLADLDFVKDRRIALFLGKPGTGKTHLALAIGVKAAQVGKRVYCTSVKRLAQRIQLAKGKGTLDRLFTKMLAADLWILDDWGVVSMSRDTAEEVFDLLDRRKHASAMILTSNRDVCEWGHVFPEPVLASAAIDRLFDRAEIMLFTGQSYRLKGRITNLDIDAEKETRQ